MTNLTQPLIAVQAVLPLSDVPVATSILVLSQFLGGSVFLSIASNLFQSKLNSSLSSLSSTLAESIIGAGAMDLRDMVPNEMLYPVLLAYNVSIVGVFVSGPILDL